MESDSIPGESSPLFLLTTFLSNSLAGSEIALIILLILVLLLISGIVSGSEVAYFSFTPADREKIRKESDKAAERIERLMEKPRYLLATILILNNLVNVAIVVLSYFVLSAIFHPSALNLGVFVLSSNVVQFLVNVLSVTFFLVLLGEVIPKVYATQDNMKLARFTSGPLLFFRQFFRPLSAILVNSTLYIEKKLPQTGTDISAEDLDHAIKLATEESSSKEEVKILQGIVQFGNITVKQIMRSRVDMVVIKNTTSFDELMDLVRKTGYSRIPVVEDNADNIRGILYVKDLLNHLSESKAFDWQDLVREALFVPETKKIDDLLRDIQEKRMHMAIVVDEYGGTSGLITLEDIVEEVGWRD